MEGCLFPFHIVNDLWSLAASLPYFLLQTEEQSKKAAESIRILATLLLQQVQAEGGSFLGRRGLRGSEQQKGLGVPCAPRAIMKLPWANMGTNSACSPSTCSDACGQSGCAIRSWPVPS